MSMRFAKSLIKKENNTDLIYWYNKPNERHTYTTGLKTCKNSPTTFCLLLLLFFGGRIKPKVIPKKPARMVVRLVGEFKRWAAYNLSRFYLKYC